MYICLNLFSVHVTPGVASQPCVWKCLVCLTLQVLFSLVDLNRCPPQDAGMLQLQDQVRHPMLIQLPPRHCLSPAPPPPDATPLALEDGPLALEDADWVVIEEVECWFRSLGVSEKDKRCCVTPVSLLNFNMRIKIKFKTEWSRIDGAWMKDSKGIFRELIEPCDASHALNDE